MANPQIFFTVVALGKESTWGIEVARNVFLPVEQPRFQPKNFRHVMDTGLRGKVATDYDLLPGAGEGTFNWQGNFYIDSVPNLIMSLLGTDQVMGASPPFTHEITPAGTPPSYTIEWQTNTRTWNLLGAYVEQFTLNFNARDGILTYQVQGQSKLGEIEASPTSASFSTQSAIMGWQGTVSVAGGTPSPLLEGSLTLQRTLRIVHKLNNTQDVGAIYPGPLQVNGRITFDYSSATEYDYYGTNTQTTKNEVILTFQNDANHVAQFTMPKAGWRVVDIEESDSIYTQVAQLNGIYDPNIDGPVKVTVLNDRNTAY